MALVWSFFCIYNFYDLFLTVLGLHCCMGSRSYSLVVVHGLLIMVASLVMGASLVVETVKNLPATQVQSLGQEGPLRRKWQPLQYSCLENSLDRVSWWATDHGGLKKSDTTEKQTLSLSLSLSLQSMGSRARGLQ